MRTPYHAFLAAILILVAGCRSEKNGQDPVVSIPFASARAVDLGQFIEQVQYVQLENHPQSAFTDIDKMIISGDNMFMLDKRLEAVFCFETNGRFRYRIQAVGRGPGEYQELDAIWVKAAEKELWLQSFWPSKILVYNFGGELLREFPIRWSARDMVRIGEDLLAGYNSSPSNDGADSLNEGIFLLGEDGKYKGQPKVIGDSSIYWSVVYQRNLEEIEDGSLIISQSDTIYKIDRKGNVTADIFLDWGKYKYPSDLAGICYNSPRSAEAFQGKFVTGKDQLIAFGPIRLFRIIRDGHLEMAIADVRLQKGYYSGQITSGSSKIPLLYPLAKSERGELVGMYDMSLLLAMKESRTNRTEDSGRPEIYQAMDSLVESAMIQDRPVLWIAKIKPEWLTK